MNTNDSSRKLPAGVVEKLRKIRRRARVLGLLEGLVRTGTVLLAAMLVAMLIDLAVGWLDPRARYTITSVALGSVAVLFLLWCAMPFLRRRTIVSTAREVEEASPQLEERWSTVTELAQNNDPAEVRGSQAMIDKVGSEAELASSAIIPRSVVSARPLFNASRWLLGTAAILVGLVLVNFTQARVLLHRFWLPGDNVSLTELSVSPADTWVPKGEALMLNATVSGAVPKNAPKLAIRPAAGVAKEISMAPKKSEKGAFQHAIGDVSDSFEFRARAGDGQTPWHRITAVDRPEISAVKLIITPPAYTHLPKEEKDALPQGVRVLQGSEVTVAFKCDQALEKMFLDLGEGRTAPLSSIKEQWYEHQSRPTEGYKFAAVALNQYKLENKNKPSSRISVYEDLPPSLKVAAPEDVAVLPGEKVKVDFEASDDFGIAKAEVTVTTTKADGETKVTTLPVDLAGEEGKKQVRKSVELDPAALGLKNGDQLTYVVKVTDTKQVPAEASAESKSGESKDGESKAGEAKAGEPKDGESKAGEAKAGEPKDGESKAGEAKAGEPKDGESKAGEAKAGEPKDGESKAGEAKAGESKDGESEKKPDLESKGEQQAKAGDQKSEEKPPGGTPPPPNDMSKRMLDAGQCSSCKAMRVTVDEFAGTFEGEKRQKLEIAIAPVLEQLASLLKTANEKTDVLKADAATETGLQEKDAEALGGAKGSLTQSESAISQLNSRTGGTPYAFIGLQLKNIGVTHISPAHRDLDQVLLDPSALESNVQPIDDSSFHIVRARDMLADLTRTFEKVKREQKIADAMQKLAKMHQIFIEDTQAMLGGKKPPINSYQRKIAEVNEEYAEKLKAMLEEKKKILAELSKLLAEDPRLLRRFLAMQQMQASTYRDQMTLLAERQKQMQKQITTWNGAAEDARPDLLPQFREDFSAGQRKVVQDAAALRENMETWLPLDVKPETKEVTAALRRAEKIMELIAQDAKSEDAENKQGKAALDELAALREQLQQLREISSEDKTKLVTYISNRRLELETLVTSQTGQMAIQASLKKGDFPKVAEISQQDLARETATLGHKLEATEKEVARLSDEISKKAAELNKTVKADIVDPQDSSVEQLANRDLKSAGETINNVVPAFETAEQTFDELMRMIIAKLDESPAPTAPGEAPQLDALLAMLQDEMKAQETLGIPCRPTNVMVNSDWMKPSSSGMAQAQAQAAQAQSQKAKGEAEKIEKQARENAAKQGAAAVKEDALKKVDPVASTKRDSDWNKLGSKLKKDLLQGRDNTPPEQYRSAIDNYFKIISEASDAAEKK
jgi:hypothetical protein